MNARTRTIIGTTGIVVLVASLGATVFMVLVYSTRLQEARYRLMGLAGVTTIVVAGCAVVATAGALAALPMVRSHRWVLLVALTPWLFLALLTAQTVSGIVVGERTSGGEQFTVVAQNLWYENSDPAATARAIVARDADVMVLTEYTPKHHRAIVRETVGDYPYRWERPGRLGGGIGVLSRIPFEDPVELPTSTPAVRLELSVGGEAVTLVALHPVSPSDMYSLPKWKYDYGVLFDQARNLGPNTVVAGDFNATRGHRRFRALANEADLRDAQDVSGAGFVATWPVGAIFPPVMRLDHILVGPGIGVADFDVLGDLGSDHRGVEARLQVPRS